MEKVQLVITRTLKTEIIFMLHDRDLHHSIQILILRYFMNFNNESQLDGIRWSIYLKNTRFLNNIT